MNIKFAILLLILSVFLISSCATFSESDKLYSQAREFIKEGREDFAFMRLNQLLREYPDYRFRASVKFAVAEYYFLDGNYTRAIGELVDFLNTYPENKMSIFAKSMLYKIISDIEWLKSEKADEIADDIRKEFFSSPVFFVFSEFKEKSAVSLFGNSYVLKEYVDKIDIFQNGKIFLSVSP